MILARPSGVSTMTLYNKQSSFGHALAMHSTLTFSILMNDNGLIEGNILGHIVEITQSLGITEFDA